MQLSDYNLTFTVGIYQKNAPTSSERPDRELWFSPGGNTELNAKREGPYWSSSSLNRFHIVSRIIPLFSIPCERRTRRKR